MAGTRAQAFKDWHLEMIWGITRQEGNSSGLESLLYPLFSLLT